MAIEDEFGIAISGNDSDELHTFGDARDYVVRQLYPSGCDAACLQQIWKRICSVIATAPDYGAVENPDPSDPFVQTG